MQNDQPSRRAFLSGTAGLLAGLAASETKGAEPTGRKADTAQSRPRKLPAKGRFPVKVISSDNGLQATRCAYELVLAGRDPLDACIAGVGIVEDDPNDMTV